METAAKALTEDELIAAIGGVHVLGIRSGTQVTERVLDAAPAVARHRRVLHRGEPDRPGGRVPAGRRGVQRAVLQHAQRGRAGPGRDHRDDQAAHRQERPDARGCLGQVGGGQPRGARPPAGHRGLRQHRRAAVGPGREPGHDGVLLRHRGQAGPGQRPALRHAGRAAGDRRRGHPARGRPARQQRPVRRGRVRGHEGGQPVPQPVPRVRGGSRGPAPQHRVRAPGRGGRGRVPGRAPDPRRGVRLGAARPAERHPHPACRRLHRGGPAGHRRVRGREAARLRQLAGRPR